MIPFFLGGHFRERFYHLWERVGPTNIFFQIDLTRLTFSRYIKGQQHSTCLGSQQSTCLVSQQHMSGHKWFHWIQDKISHKTYLLGARERQREARSGYFVCFSWRFNLLKHGFLREMFYMKELAQLDPNQKDAQHISATLGVLYSPPLVVFQAPMVLNQQI